jgi:hypothetical protein
MIQVQDDLNALVLDNSDAVFSIKGGVAFTEPNSSRTWVAGTANNIVWDRNGTIGNINLYYNVNAGVDQVIVLGVASPLATGSRAGVSFW